MNILILKSYKLTNGGIKLTMVFDEWYEAQEIASFVSQSFETGAYSSWGKNPILQILIRVVHLLRLTDKITFLYIAVE